jgi:cytochrome P450 family 6
MFLNFFISFTIVLIVGFYWFYKRSWSFWSDRNIQFIKPQFPAGNINDVIKAENHFGTSMKKIYDEMKKTGIDYCGVFTFTEKSLLVLTPEFAKTILVRDFNTFMNRGIYCNERDDPMSAHLFFIAGQKWKDLRAKIVPTFTSAKLKRMFHTIFEVGNRFIDHLITLSDSSNEIEIYDLLARFNTDVIGSCAFGFESNSLKEPDNEFRTMGRKMLSFGRFKMLRLFFAMSFQNTAKFFGIKFNDTDVSEFFMSVVRETIEYRKKTGSTRNDFMQLLIELMDRNEKEDKLTFNEVAAQAFVFYFAGVSYVLLTIVKSILTSFCKCVLCTEF